MMRIQVSLPGKVMLSGEYAVLRGSPALAASIDRRLTVEVSSEIDANHAVAPEERGCLVTSNLWLAPRWVRIGSGRRAAALPPVASEDMLTDAVRAGMELFQVQRAQVQVTSELDVSSGVGSSSALRLGVLAAMACYAGEWDGDTEGMSVESGPLKPAALWRAATQAYLLQRREQKVASGYDTLTQLLGGIVRMDPPRQPNLMDATESDILRRWPGSVHWLSRPQDDRTDDAGSRVVFFVGGPGAPTGRTIARTLPWLDADSRRWDSIAELASTAAEAWQEFVAVGDQSLRLTEPAGNESLGPMWHRLCAAVGAQRRFFESAPGFPESMAWVFADLPGLDEIFTYKTTGAGGEDAVMCLVPDTGTLGLVNERMERAGWRMAKWRLGGRGLACTRRLH